MADWNANINSNIGKQIIDAANRGLALGAEHILGESNQKVPIEEATLMRSGTVSTDPTNNRAAVSYDTPYAVKQHEDMTARHDPGRTAKYLEQAMNTSVPAVREIITQAIRGVI